MQKIKVFIIVSMFLLVAAGVLAKRKYTAYSIYASNGTVYCRLTTATTLVGMSIMGSTQATITSSLGNTYGLYGYNAGTYYPLYTTGTCF